MFHKLPLSWWQYLLLWPGATFMDWLARTWPDVVIRYGFGFTMESYVFWSAVLSLLFWFVVLVALVWVLNGLRRSRGARHSTR
ncbi:hypothetical protein [Aquisalimonas asiatica]|uniref:Uncharacterized protein n=1 Tax=Aquisalimonas asiatica TaxID=406100 RepID=A0A1H8UJ95_9GAMM|nr:hypothetical protein [Aquisalimonas asiatica]SEP03241.1 hypothetical protein SAMN04488052_10721 [Aquisalimonas asiatica]